MQRSLIRPGHAYVSRHGKRPRCVSKIENGLVYYREFIFGIPIFHTQSIDEFTDWAHEDVELLERRHMLANPPRTAG